MRFSAVPSLPGLRMTSPPSQRAPIGAFADAELVANDLAQHFPELVCVHVEQLLGQFEIRAFHASR